MGNLPEQPSHGLANQLGFCEAPTQWLKDFSICSTLSPHIQKPHPLLSTCLAQNSFGSDVFRRGSFPLRGFVLKVSESSEICAVGGRKKMLPGDSCRVFGASKRCLKAFVKTGKVSPPKKKRWHSSQREDYARMGIDTPLIPSPNSPWRARDLSIEGVLGQLFGVD